jgi:hypothetical protein
VRVELHGFWGSGGEELLAESLVLRGARRGGAAIDSDAALSALDSVLLAEGAQSRLQSLGVSNS